MVHQVGTSEKVSSMEDGVGKVEADIRHNAQAVAEAERAEADLVVQKQVAAGQEAEGKSFMASMGDSLATRSKSAGKALVGNEQECSLATDVALEACTGGVGSLFQVGKMAVDAVADRDPFKMAPNKFGLGAEAKTFDALMGNVGKADGKREIRTTKDFGAAANINNTSYRLGSKTGDTKSWSGVQETTATLTGKIEKSPACSLKRGLGQSVGVHRDLAAKAGNLMRMGVGQTQAYQHASVSSPKGYVEQKIDVDDSTETWAS